MTDTASSPMVVYLVPCGTGRYELYCEMADVEPGAGGEAEGGWFAGLRARFRAVLSVAEAERRSGRPVDSGRRWTGRLRARVIGSIAEAVAEQRLLWNLRHQTDACLVYPDDLPEARATERLRGALRRDADKHRRWFVIDLCAFAASGLLAVIPGPNVIAYYVAFRLVGHFFSFRGGRHGLSGVRWQARPAAPLSELRRALELPRSQWGDRLQAVAERLELRHLAAFVERIAVSAACYTPPI